MVVTVKKYDKTKNSDLIKKHYDLTGEKLNELSTLVFYEKMVSVGYVVLIYRPEHVELNWIYGPKYEKKIMEKLEAYLLKNNINTIKTYIILDPTENKEATLKRLNFYIDLSYFVYDIKFSTTCPTETTMYIKKNLFVI